MNDYTRIVAERVPEEEMDVEDGDFIQVFHFQNEPSRIHGIPFRFLVKEVCRPLLSRLGVVERRLITVTRRARFSRIPKSAWRSERV